jgi:putative tryptophan/tyrosine transport system ATP-binding protein
MVEKMMLLQDISKTFHRGQVNEVAALKPLSLEINRGDFVVVVGANGSGKSTLLNVISGQLRSDGGMLLIEGTDVTRLQDFQRSRWIARVFQNPLSGTAPDLSIIENFRLAALRTQSKSFKIGNDVAFRELVREKIASLGMGLETKVDQLMGTLSGGQRQALTLLMCVMDDLSILLLDEPTAALDPRSAAIVIETADQLIKDYELTAILITHNMKEACTVGNRILQMHEGHLVKDISAESKQRLREQDIYQWFIAGGG